MKSLWRSSFLTLVLLAIDAIALAEIWLGVYALRLRLDTSGLRQWMVSSGRFFSGWFPNPVNVIEPYAQALPILLVVWLIVLAYFKFYSHHERIASLNRIGPAIQAVIWMFIGVTIYNIAFKPDFGRSIVPTFAGISGLYLLGSRTLFRAIKQAAIRRGHGRVRALVVGAGDLGRETMARVHDHPDIGFKIVGFISASDEETETEIEGYPVLGGLEDLLPVIHRHRVEEVFLAVPDMKEDDVLLLVEKVQNEAPIVCKVVANMLYVIVNRAKVDEIIGLPVIAFRGRELYPAELLAKRLIDIVVGGALLVLLALPALVFALLVRLDSKGPALFVHGRVGRGGRLFQMLKFRTMTVQSDAYAEAPLDQTDPRVTRFGRFLRRTSLDEIPQLLNVLKGDMSLVGPRPEMPFIVDGYNEWQKVRLEAKPGLTGLWQVAGRKNLPLHYNLEYDFHYVKNQSLGLDFEILLRTVPAVFLGKGAY